MADATHKTGKKNRKHGRNKISCQRYRTECRRVKNKIKRLKKHLKNQPLDAQSEKSLKNYLTNKVV